MLAVIFGFLLATFISILVWIAYVIIGSFILWMSVDAAKQDRFWWVALILGVPVVGAAAYYFTEKKHEYAKAPNHHVHKSETESQHEHVSEK